ncbi:SpoIIE family protein phosphatase [Geomonas sp.]|uniref:SpoIIE family protein phosphatase n=1 Tax=Geomonas sp. TaxID=2651584 RepID=UPI002B45CB39|nr:SpoIIE family protein phosphatase [Geomonas sp.]HJV35300.1 SpoIIE family protein phosphatase [Geomonas sp.]
MGKPLRVLIVEDSEDDALLLVFELRNANYSPIFKRVESFDGMKIALEGERWDLVISDYVVPGFGGLEALKLVRQCGLDLPFIIVSGKIGEGTAISAMKEGANDYLIKGYFSRLVPAIEREIQEAEVRRRRREAEAALARSERRYKRLVSAVTDYIYTVTIKDGTVLKTSHGPGCLPVTGYRSEDYQKNPLLWYQMIYEEDRAAVTSLTDQICSGKDIPSLEHRIRHQDGSIRWVINTIVPRYNDQGKLTAYDGLISDITERKRAEESLRLQSAALQAAANAIVITDRHGVIIWVNQAFTRMTGYQEEEAQGRDLDFLNSAVLAPECYPEHRAAMEAGKVWQGEHFNRRKDGTLYPVEQTITPVADDGGVIRHFICINQEISERKLAERAMMENTRILKEMEIAKQIQMSLLPPSPPRIPGIDCAGRCLPATHLGGDYYDFFPHGDRLDLVIADVSGHSVGAALIMVETRSVLRAKLHSLHTPGQVVSALNDLLYDDLTRAELLITMTYLSLDRKGGRLRYVNAGHPPSLLYRPATSSFEELDAEGLILGVRKGIPFDESTVQTKRGDLLLLYTDGLVEAEGKGGELFGTERLRDLLAAHHNRSAAEILTAVVDEVHRFSGTTSLQDDTSLFLIKFL